MTNHTRQIENIAAAINNGYPVTDDQIRTAFDAFEAEYELELDDADLLTKAIEAYDLTDQMIQDLARDQDATRILNLFELIFNCYINEND